MIRVGVVGATGKMGRALCAALVAAPDLELVAAVSRSAVGSTLAEATGIEGSDLVLVETLDEVLAAGAELSVDFTSGAFAPEHVAWGIEHRVHVVVGTTGFEIDPAWAEQRTIGVFVAPNFAIGAALMMRFASDAARLMPDAEIIELHHDGKVDAPSGTAIATARAISTARGKRATSSARDDRATSSARDDRATSSARDDRATSSARDDRKAPATGGDAARGADIDGVRVHSVRLPGLLANQEVVFGAPGESLTIRHDTTDRSAFVPGVLMAIRATPGRPGLTVGLGSLLDR